MGKRQAGFGAVYRRRDGRWEGQIRIPGGRRCSFYGHSKRDLIHKLADARWALGEGLPVSAGTQSRRAYLEYWLIVCRTRLRPSQLVTYGFPEQPTCPHGAETDYLDGPPSGASWQTRGRAYAVSHVGGLHPHDGGGAG
jgi:hypothetical protein